MAAASPTSFTGYFALAPWVVFFPLLGLLINLLFGGRLSKRTVGWIASLASGAAFVVSALLAFSLSAHPEGTRVFLGEWIHIGELKLDWAFRVDTLSVTMMLVVSGVGTLIHIYAIGYMDEDVTFKGDPGRYRRFFVFFNLFIVAMMILVSGDSYLMLFVGWEGVGLCSFLLIGFWYEMDTLGRPSWANSNAAKKAFITNRIGDFGFLVAALLMFWGFGTLNFEEVFAKAPQLAAAAPGLVIAITLFMLLGVSGKSAQVPLYVWLPDAMAGPTPVSALIHAATMVTAGVYLIARSAPLYVTVPAAQYLVAMVGAVTALFAATIAVGQYDIKKVLAYSTISQLGFMVAAVGMGAFVAGMFHLVTHAFFKALLFLSAGSVILGLERGHHALAHGHHHDEHATAHSEDHGAASHDEVFDPGDMRNMGGLRRRMPLTFWLYLIGTLALAGIFPFAGFWSKDEILADAFREGYTAVYWLLTVAAFFTAFYMGRQIWLVFFGEPRHEAAAQAKESPAIITVPLIALAVLSVFGGALNLPGIHTFTNWLEHTLEMVHAGEFIFSVAALSTVLALMALALSWWIYGRRPLVAGQADPLKGALGPLFTALENKWYVDEGYWAVFVNRYVDLARFLAEKVEWAFWHEWFHDRVLVRGFNFFSRDVLHLLVDRKWVDAFFDGLAKLTARIASKLSPLQSGFVRAYALTVLLGVVAILGYLLYRP